MLRTILKKIVFQNVFPKVVKAFLLEIFTSGGISDGIKIFRFSRFLRGPSVVDFDGIDAESV